MSQTVSIWTRRAGLAAAMLVVAGSAVAEGPRYTFGEIGYSQVDFDNFNEDAEMFGANGSLAISDRRLPDRVVRRRQHRRDGRSI